MSRMSAGKVLAFSSFVCVLLTGASGQQPADLFTKAPPAIDEALRDRISKFFQLQVDGKPRQAEQYVAEDSKDYYYEMQKPRYLSYEIRSISYSDEFTKAKAMIAVEMIINIPQFQNKPMKIPFMTLWKVVDGQWFWYVQPEASLITPFGKMNPGPGKPGEAQAGGPPDMSKTPDILSLWKQVSADKQGVQLKAHEASSDRVTISSQLAGTVSLQFQPPDVPGLVVKLDRTELKAGEKAVLSFDFKPGENAPRSPLVVNVLVQPINSVISVRAVFE
ncbi:MAG TPA: hypothetical protein VNY30_05305 [Bryobacteraceae bacterium]|nr:hypothetical protein [Bryobacteraceae bacterium]